jgi:UrcA family protein
MMSNMLNLRQACAGVAAAGALVGALATPIGHAAAQTAYVTQEQMTIIAPYAHRQIVGPSDAGAPIEELLLPRVVEYRHLNLSNRNDVRTLDDRVRQAAYLACKELDREYPEALYPRYQSNSNDCVARATDQGMAQARFVVAQANAYPP